MLRPGRAAFNSVVVSCYTDEPMELPTSASVMHRALLTRLGLQPGRDELGLGPEAAR